MTEQQPQKKKGINTFSTFYLIILLIFVVSMWFLFRAIIFYQEGLIDEFMTSTLIAAMGLATSGYMLFQMRRRTGAMAAMAQKPEVVSVLECAKCGFKNLRKFLKGDYVFKVVELCPRCSADSLVITAIYQQEDEKAKSKA